MTEVIYEFTDIEIKNDEETVTLYTNKAYVYSESETTVTLPAFS